MKKGTIYILISLLVGVQVRADERLYKRLERKMTKNPTKGLAYAQKLKRNRSVEPDAYFFLAQYQYRRYETVVSQRKKYLAINRSASDLGKARKLATSHPYLKPQLDSLVSIISHQLALINDSLYKDKSLDQMDRINRKYYKLTGQYLPTSDDYEQLAEKKAEQEKIKLRIAKKVEGIFYGLPTGNEEVPSSDYKAEREFLNILNAERKRKGLKPLYWDESLARAARYHAFDMASQRYFSHHTHDRIDGKTIQVGGAFERIRNFYTGVAFVNSENIAAGNKAPKDVFHQWDTSKGHHKNMFNKSSTWIGVGVIYDTRSPYKYYWVMCTAR